MSRTRYLALAGGLMRLAGLALALIAASIVVAFASASAGRRDRAPIMLGACATLPPIGASAPFEVPTLEIDRASPHDGALPATALGDELVIDGDLCATRDNVALDPLADVTVDRRRRSFARASRGTGGIRVLVDTSGLPLGRHRIVVRFTSGHSTVAAPPLDVVVAEPAPPRPFHIGGDGLTGFLEKTLPLRAASMDGDERTPLALASNDDLYLQGWLLDLRERAPMRALTVLIDGVRSFAAAPGDVRPELRDAAATIPPLVAVESGFRAIVPMHGLAPGVHRLDLVATRSDGSETTVVRAYAFETYSV